MKTKSHNKKTKSKKRERLVLLDAHAIIHRAYHALPDFSTASGEPTGALYGLVAMLVSIIEELKPDYIAAAFDLPGPTHRHAAYEAYKGTRKKTEDSLALQLNRAKDVFNAWGIPIYSEPGFEADDILGTVVEKYRDSDDIEIVIASGDMDTLQLVRDDYVQVYTLKKGIKDTILYNEDRVKERFGFSPTLLPDYKGLRGDPSDNIVGVMGIGEKTATSLITTFGTVEDIYKALKKGKDEYKKAGITDRVALLLLQNEEEALFSKTLATIRRDAPIEFTMPEHWLSCLNMDALLDLFRVLEFRTMGERVKMLCEKAEHRTVETQVKDTKSSPKEIKTKKKPSKELSDDEQKLAIALWVVDSNLTDPGIEDVYAFTKASTLEEARTVLEHELDKRNVRRVYEEIELPLMPVIRRMDERGVKIDKEFLKKISDSYHEKLSALEKEIWKNAGEEFNINSPKQLSEILFTKLALADKRQKKTSSGGFSTKESELEKLRDRHEIIDLILKYRELQKLLSTYIDVIPAFLDDKSRLHSHFLQAGTTTGRMSSEHPNLQNIPIKTEQGKAIRKAFIAERGYSLISLDYSQIELRIAAILSGDKKLIDIFKNGIDVHTGVASRMFRVPESEVNREMRRQAKVINFGILYGMGVTALKTNLGTDRKDAQEFYNNYFETFSELAAYLDRIKAEASRQGYTETMFGRRRYFSGFRSPLPYIRAQAERMAINAPIQGTEADIVKIAMIHIEEYIHKKGWNDAVFPILNVHDEIVYEVRDDLVPEVEKAFKKIMESVVSEKQTKGVPIVAEAATGKNWGVMKE